MKLRRLLTPSAAVAAAVVLGAVAVGLADASSETSDVQMFARAGAVLLSPHALHAYAGEEVQAGPLELALAAGAHGLGHGQAGFAVLLDLVCTAALTFAAWMLLDGRAGLLALFGLGAYALWLPGAGYDGHPAEVLIAVLWLLAAREARRGRTTLAGVYLGLSACFEVWGVLGVTVLALAPSLRSSARGLVIAGLLPLLAFLPFVLGGDFHMFGLQWPIDHGLPKLLLGTGRDFTWPMRLAEAAVVVGAGTVVARSTRRLEASVWIVPAATALVRIGCDPVLYGYYWTTPLVCLLIGATQLLGRRTELAGWVASRAPLATKGH